MLDYSQITQRKYITLDNEPYEVISSHIFRKQQRKPVNQTKLKNLISGRVIERSFHQSEKAEEAEVGVENLIYLYSNDKKGEIWFSKKNDQRNRFALPEEIASTEMKFIKENQEVEALIFTKNGEDKIVSIRMPIKVELKVKETPPGIRGNTAQGGTKPAVLETGVSVVVPLFINEGDVICVNTETGEYVERVSKK